MTFGVRRKIMKINEPKAFRNLTLALLLLIISSTALAAEERVDTYGNIFSTDQGRVGIGNSNPYYKLDVYGSIRVHGGGFVLSNGTDPPVSFMKTYGNYNWGYNILFNPGAELVIGAGESAYQLTNDGDATGGSENLHLSADGSIFLWSGAQEGNQKRAVTINSTGNVGIGNSAPAYKLDVNGSVRVHGGEFVMSNGTDPPVSFMKNYGDYNWGYNILFNPGAELVIGAGESAYQLTNDGDASGGSENLHLSADGSIFLWSGAQGGYQKRAVTINSTGNVGIGMMSPATQLDVSGIARSKFSIISAGNATEGGQLTLADGGQYNLTGESANAWNIDVFNSRLRFHRSSSGEKLTITESGNVGIGTANPQSELAVYGTITAKEIKVTEADWSDFVFDDAYELPSLNSVESYVKEHNHLPDIPSAKDVEQQGIAVSEMLARQMQKIEELTLYLIKLNKENDRLKQRVALLERSIDSRVKK